MNKTDIKPAPTGNDVRAMFGGVTGTDEAASGHQYPFLKVFADAVKQSKRFVDAEQDGINWMKLHGKLFVQSRGISSADLVDSVSGTIIKEQSGAEILDKNFKVVWRKNHQVFPEKNKKGEYLGLYRDLKETYGFYPKNFTRLFLALDEPMVQSNGKSYDVVIVTINGSAHYPHWVKTIKSMKYELIAKKPLAEYDFEKIGDVPVSFWHLTVGAVSDKNSMNAEYWRMDFNIDVNPLEKAIKFKSLIEEAQKYDLLTLRPIGQDAAAITVPEEQVEMDMDEISANIEASKKALKAPVVDDDLPF